MVVNETDKAYKRGVVLGLTLAELLILFVFCLLLLFTAWALQSLESKNAEAKSPSQEVRTWEIIKRDLEQLGSGKSAEAVWREMIAAYRESKREKRTPADASDDSIKSQVMKDLEEMRGEARLDEYWSQLKWANQEAARLVNVNRKLLDDLDKTKSEKSKAEQERAAAQDGAKLAKEEAERARQEAERAKGAEAKARAEADGQKKADASRKGHTWPPIIELKEADQYKFVSGDSRLSKKFEDQLRGQVIEQILEYIKEYEVDVIEVAGHTDDVPVGNRQSNLDVALLPFLWNEKGHPPLYASDNAGLGMARAASVARFLRSDVRLNAYTILPVSSAQAVDSEGKLAKSGAPRDAEERRRITIRLRRSDKATVEPGR